jgi:hypothetical protein
MIAMVITSLLEEKMKKIMTLTLTVLMLAAVFAGCGQAPANNTQESDQPAQSSDAVSDEPAAVSDEPVAVDPQEPAANDATTSTGYPVADSYTAYLNAKEVVMSKLSDGLGSSADSLSATFTLLGVAMVDLGMLPVSFFGIGEEAAAMGLSMLSAEDVKYTENGNNYSISYKDSNGATITFSGTYDPAADALVCSSTTNGKENFYSEYRKTSFGYVSQYYFVNEDGTTSLYQFAANGEDGTFGVSANVPAQPAALTGSESADFPTALPEWYSITGSTITGKTSEGTELNFEYVPSATE